MNYGDIWLAGLMLALAGYNYHFMAALEGSYKIRAVIQWDAERPHWAALTLFVQFLICGCTLLYTAIGALVVFYKYLNTL